MYDFRDDWGVIVFSSDNLEEVKEKARAYKKRKNMLTLCVQKKFFGIHCWI